MTSAAVRRLREAPLHYEAGPDAASWLAEAPPEPLTEAELSRIWAGQRYPHGALTLADGRSLRVLNPGRPGVGAGPDFLDAVVQIDGKTVRGDVELHVRASWFQAHGHDTDPAYDGVVLHVVFRADDGVATRLHNGSLAPVAAFAPWFDNRRDELQRWLGAEALWQEPCQRAVWQLGEEYVRQRLRDAGLRRFDARVEALRQTSQEVGEDEALWRALFDLVGVGGDREGYRRLAVQFPASLARGLVASPDAAALAQGLLYVAGLAVAPRSLPLPSPLRPPLSASGRPANRPERRLAGIAALYEGARSDLPGFARRTVAEATTARTLIAAWQVSRQGVALIGPERARELVLNLVLPFAAFDRNLRPQALQFAQSLSAAPAYGKTLFLERNLRQQSGKRLVRTALEQQGLLAMLGQWCSQGGCGRCPLS